VAKRLRKWLKRILFGVLALALTAWLGGAWLVKRSIAQPPPLPADTSVMRLKPESRDGKMWLGQSWAGRRDGLLVVHLKGSPLELGYAAGALLREHIQTLENEFLDMVHGYVSDGWKLNVLKWYVMYRNRHLSDFIPVDYRMEIYGSSLGGRDGHPELGNYYNRLLNYHAAHDVSYMMIDNPLVSRAGCTSFGAWGKETANGHLITGRNFDWEAAEVFSRERTVILFEPDNGIPFISLSWAGMAGVVSGMNRAGMSVTVNGAPSSLPRDTATPVAMVARDVLQRTRNMNEALELLRNAKVFVSTLWLIGSRADGKFLIVEKTPDATHVREPEGESIICANHFQTAELKDEPRNQTYIADATSVSRQSRLGELLGQARGTISASRTAELLRDRRLPGGQFPGNGHRATLNAFIATHATIMDLTDGIFWAASPPNQLGKFVAFDVQDFSRELPERTITADPVIASGELDRARQAQKCLADGRRALQRKDAAAALKLAEQAEQLNPGFYQNAALRGRALVALDRRSDAVQAFEASLAAHPAFLSEKQELKAMLEKAKNSDRNTAR